MKDFTHHEDTNRRRHSARAEQTNIHGTNSHTDTSRDDLFFDENEDGIPVIVSPENNVSSEFGSGAGLYSKFTQSRPVDTLAVMHNQARNNEEGQRDDTETLNSSFLSVKDHYGDRESYREEEFHHSGYKKIKYESMFILSVLFTTFSVEFINSIEIVYMTPFFLKLNLNEKVDATFWMFPVIITLMFTPIVEVISSHLSFKNKTLYSMMSMVIAGCFMFSFSDDIALYFVHSREEKAFFLTYFGLVAFCLVDFTNEMVLYTERKVIEESGYLKEGLERYANISSSAGKLFGFFCGSFQALGINVTPILEKNFDFCFLIAGFLMAFSFILSILFVPNSTKGYKSSIMAKLKKLKCSHFLPPASRVLAATPRMKCLVLSHLFGAGNILLLTVYATSWVGITVLQGDPDAAAFTLRHKLFEAGVSWGSLALVMTSFIILATGYAVYKMLEDPKKSKFKYTHIAAQLIASVALLSCFYSDDFMDIFVILPLTGFAFETFHMLPEIIADMIEMEEQDVFRGRYRSLLGFSFFCAQVMMFLINPLIFLYYPDTDDNLWGMAIAGGSGLLSVLFGLFV